MYNRGYDEFLIQINSNRVNEITTIVTIDTIYQYVLVIIREISLTELVMLLV